MLAHGPSEKASRATATARWTSSTPAWATSAIARPVAGSSVSNVRPSAASGRSDPIRRRCDFEMNSRAAAPSASGRVSAEIVVMEAAYPPHRARALIGHMLPDGRALEGGADNRLLLGHRSRERAGARARWLDGVRDRAPARVDRRAGRRRLPHARARRDRRGLDARGRRRRRAGRGRRRGADQQRRLQPERRDRDGADRGDATAVRDQRVRSRAPDPARPAEDARPALGQDRQRRLDGRAPVVPGRRQLPRDQVRAGGDLRRDALRAARLRHRRDPARAGPDHDRVRRRGEREHG